MKYHINIRNWGKINKHDIFLYELKNDNNMQVFITNYGASIQSIMVPDNNGNIEDVVLGYDQLQDYIDDTFYLGSIVGRYANRIEGGKVEINGKTYRLTVKDGGFHHHGGEQGFNKKIWEAKPFRNEQGLGVVLTYYSVDGEEGFPGNLLTTVTYTLNNKNQLTVDFYATTDSATLINLTQHTYFNLTGYKKESILDHQLMMPLNNYLPVTAMQVPTGELASVVGTPFDFKQVKKIGEHINQNHEQLILSNGYDHSWIIKKHNSSDLKLAARLLEAKSKRVLNVFTTEPSIHLYTGNYLDGATKGKSGVAYPVRSGLCLETQHYPDAPNHPHFPSTVLTPGKAYKSRTVFEFSLINKLITQFNN